MRASSTFTNWGQNQRCRPVERHAPTSEAAIKAILTNASTRDLPVKVVGGGHSWSGAACTDGVHITLDRLDGVLDVDLARNQVTVEAGIRLHALIEALAAVGLALENVGSVTEQSIAGAISTGTHGSGARFGNLATQVVALRLICADASVRYLRRDTDGDLFAAAALGIGALGIVSAVTLQCEPLFDLEEHTYPLHFEEAVATMASIVESHEHVKFWWLPHQDHVSVYTYDRTHRTPTRSLMRTVEERFLNAYGFRGILYLNARRPSSIPTTNRAIARSYMRAMRRVGRYDRLLTVPMPPVHRESEFGIPMEDAGAALRKLKQLIAHHDLRINFPVEVRFVAKDNLLLSGAHGRPSCQLGAYIGSNNPDRGRYFQLVEAMTLDMGGRPHWGKEFNASRSTLEGVYPRFGDFVAIRDRLDPNRRFRNAFLARVLGD